MVQRGIFGCILMNPEQVMEIVKKPLTSLTIIILGNVPLY